MEPKEDPEDRQTVERLAEEFASRHRAGERPSLEEYAAAHPEHADEIRDLFPTLIVMEELAGSDDDASRGGRAGTSTTLNGSSPRRVGDYRLLREIGRGGMGIVYEAVQESLGRRVALKVLSLRGGQNARLLARFRLESRAAARLHHTNIVPVFEVGEEGDICYYAMQFIQGQALDEVLKELAALREARNPVRMRVPTAAGSVAESLCTAPFGTAGPGTEPAGTGYALESAATAVLETGDTPPAPAPSRPASSELTSVDSNIRLYCRNVARIGQQVADALAYAHARGVVHRDIKPSNLLLDAAGVVWVTDFGLAKTEDAALTHTGDIVGTIRYMAPERFRGEGDARADVYALGLTLYELLVLRPAFDGQDRLRLIEQISKSDPIRPRTVDPRIPRDLETIVEKAIDKEPGRRYATAAALADDLKRFIDDRPVQARRANARERLVRWCRRSPVVAVLTASMAALLLVSAGASLWAAWRFRTLAGERELANEQLEVNLYHERIAVAHHEILASPPDIDRSQELLDKCPERLRDWEWHYLKHAWLRDPVVLAEPGEEEAYSVAFSADDRFIAAGGSHGEARVWDARSGEVVQTLRGHSRYVFCAAFHPLQDRLLASASNDSTVKLWDWRAGTVLHSWPGNGGRDYGTAYGIAFSPDGRKLAAGGEGTTVKVWSVATGDEMLSLPGHDLLALSIAFSPDSRRIVTGDYEGKVRVWDAESGAPLDAYLGASGPLSCLAFSRDGRRLAASGFDHHVRVWDVESRRLILSFRAHSEIALGVAFTPDGRRLATAGADQTLKIWDAATARELIRLRSQPVMNRAVAFSADGWRLASADRLGVRIHDAMPSKDDRDESILTIHQSVEVWAMAVSPDQRTIAVSGQNLEMPPGLPAPEVSLHEISTGKRTGLLRAHDFIVFDLAFSIDGNLLAAVGDGSRREPIVWDLRSGKEAYAVQRDSSGKVLFAAAFNPDARRLVAAGEGKAIHVWDAATGRWIGVLGEHEHECVDLGFSASGASLASVSMEGTVKLWDGLRLDARQEHPRILRTRAAASNAGICSTLAFDPDGLRLGVGSDEETASIWDVKTGERLCTYRGRGYELSSTAFSPCGRWIASGGLDSSVRLRDGRNGELIHTFRGHMEPVYRLAFTSGPDGKRLISGSRDGTVKVWDVGRWENQAR